MKSILNIFIIVLIGSNVFCQVDNIRFSYQVMPNYTANVYVSTISGTANIAGFNGGFLFKSTEATMPILDVTPATNLGWSTAGNFTSIVSNVNLSYGSEGPYDRKLEFQIIDGNNLYDGMTGGALISTTPTLIAIVTFSPGSMPGTSSNFSYQLSTSDPTAGAFTVFDNSGISAPVIVNGIVEQSLPITLKSFDAKKHSTSSVKLDWTSSKEVNSDYFGIERSKDGTTWEEIARVKAAGNSNVDLAYDYIDDRLPLSRTNGQVLYYRLRMTDLDGAFKYSDIRGVNFGKQALGPITIYPNPTTEIVNIDLSEVVMEEGDVYVSVYDMSGRLVMTKQIIGSGIELIKVDQLPSDAYNFIIRQGEQIHQQRVIKID